MELVMVNVRELLRLSELMMWLELLSVKDW